MQHPATPPRALFNVMLLGATLRLVGLGSHSLWLDEGATWSWAARPTWGGTIFAEANHPPLWWAVTRLWIGAFGDSEAALRAPAALLGCVTIGLAWLLGLRLLDPASVPRRGGFPLEFDEGEGRKAAAWFAGLVAASAFFVEYAQEARMYSALLAEVFGLSLLYLRWLDRGDRLSLVAYALLGALALHTHYFAVWPILAHAAHALWLARRTRAADSPVRPLPFLGAVVAAGLLFLPWFAYLVTHYERISTGRAFDPFSRLLYVLWRMGAGPGLVVVDRDRLVEGEQAVLAEEWPAVLGVALVWIPAFVLGLVALRRRGAAGSFLACSLLVPVLLLLAAFPWFPLIHERYLVFLAPPVFLVVTLGAFRAGRVGRPVLLGLLVALMLVGFAAYLGPSPRFVPEGEQTKVGDRMVPRAFGPDPEDPLRVLNRGHPYGKEPWRLAYRMVEDLARPGDLVCLHPAYLHLVWDYYAHRAQVAPRAPDEGPALALPTLLLPEEALDAEAIEARFGADLKERRRVFLVLAHEETEDPDHWFVALRGVLASLWVKEGATSLTAAPPVHFRRSWGVRVAIFDRP